MFIELSFVEIQDNIISESNFENYPELVGIRDRVLGNSVKLNRDDIKTLEFKQ